VAKEVIITPKAPAAVGPYSQGIKFGNILFLSGQIPINPATGDIPKSIEEQFHQALKNLQAVVEAGGSSLDRVLKVTIFLTDMNNFGTVNAVYSQYFKEDPPARSCIEVSKLPKGVDIEIEAVAAL